MTPHARRTRLFRPLIGLLAMLLVLPVTQLVGAAPASAEPNVASGAVYDALGDPLAGVTVTARTQPGGVVAETATTDEDGAYELALDEGSYRVGYAKAGFTTTSYGGSGSDALTLVVDDEGQISVDGEPAEDNVLDDVTLASTEQLPVGGLVKSSTGPLNGIVVKAYSIDDSDVPVDTATTAGGGLYELQLPRGYYNLSYTDPGAAYLPAWYGGAEPGAEITVQADGAILVDGEASGCPSLCDVTLALPPAGAEYPIAGDVVDANGEAIAGVSVAVTPTGASSDSGNGLTDAEGSYSVSVLPGTYRVNFAKTGFVAAPYTGDGGSTQATVTVASNGVLSVTPAEDLSGNHLNITTLVSVPHPVGGKVVKASAPSQPLVGITVTAFPEGDHSEAVTETTTDADGIYSLNLRVGSYDLQFTDEVPDGTDYVQTWLGGATPVPVVVNQNGTISYDGRSTLPDVAMAVPPADATYDVSGLVYDANGDGINGVVVSADPITPTPADQDETTTTATVDGDDGSWHVALEAGTYRVSFEGGAHFGDATYNGDGDTAATITVFGTGVVSVDGTPVDGGVLDGVELAGTTSYPLTGTVTNGTAGLVGITVTVYPEGDTSLGSDVATATTGAGGSYTVTDPDLLVGSYVLRFADNVADGTDYQVTWLGGATGSPVKIGQGGVITYDDATVATLPPVTMTVPPADATFEVSGFVVDALYEPIDGVTVTATPTGTTPADQDETTMTAVDGDDSHGSYTLSLEVGSYRISYDGGTAFGDATYSADGETASTITVGGTGVIRVDGVEVVGGVLDDVQLAGLTSYGLTGKVTDGNVPLQGITVKVFGEDDTAPGSEVATVTTGSTGAFAANLKVGSYYLQFSGTAGGVLYGTRWYGAGAAPGVSVQVGQGGVISVDYEPSALADVVMTPATVDSTYPLVGSTVDANYDGLAGVTVTGVPFVGGAVTSTDVSDADGLFQLDLKPGTYTIRYEKAGYPTSYYLDPDDDSVRAKVVVALDGTMTIGDNELTEGLDSQVLANDTTHPVSGTVVTETATGLGGITVEAFLDGDTSVAPADSATTGSGGAYTLDLLVGSYTLRFTDNVPAAPTYAVTYLGGETPLTVTVSTGGQLLLDYEPVSGLPPVAMTEVSADVTYPLRGFVYDEVYDPLNGATVEALPVSGTPAENAVTDLTGVDDDTGDEGVYRLEVHPGKYQLRFSKNGYQTTWLTNYDDTTRPVTVTVAANGVITAPGLDLPGGTIDDVQLLLPAPTLVTPPKLTGKVVVGTKLMASFGTWAPDLSGPAYRDSTTVDWFLDGKPSYETSGYNSQYYKVPASAVGKTLTYRVTIEDPDGERAAAIYTSAGVVVPKAVSTVKGAFKKGKLTVTVTVAGVKKPAGKVLVLNGKKTVAKGSLVAKKKGVLVLDLSKLKKGKYKLTVVYKGTPTVAGSQKVVKIKI